MTDNINYFNKVSTNKNHVTCREKEYVLWRGNHITQVRDYFLRFNLRLDEQVKRVQS